MNAQHQHYVPQLLLRGFLARNSKHKGEEQVHVFDLIEKKSFTTSIGNIMGERRYNDFWINEDTMGTIEPASGRIESHVAPLIEKIRAERKLERTPECLGDLALFMAFQFMRTKKMRLLPERLNAQVRAKVRRMGLDPARVDGLSQWDENKLKNEHVQQQLRSLVEFTKIFAKKEFFLMTAAEGSSFYLGDHPVVMHNDEPRRLMSGGLGIGVQYIQIYLPLAADLMLCAYCPAVLGQLMKSQDEEMTKAQGMALRSLMDGRVTADQMKAALVAAKEYDLISPLIQTIRAGEPVRVNREQVQGYNSLQAFQAHRFVIDPDGRFDVAKEMIAEREAADRHEAGKSG